MFKRGKSIDLCFMAVLTVFFLLFFIISFSVSRIAGMVPKLISGIGVILCLTILIREILNPNVSQEKSAEIMEGVSLYMTLLILVAYVAGLLVIGFPLSTFGVLALMPLFLGNTNKLKNIIFSVVSTAILYFLFVKLFYVRLPVGILFESIFK